MLLYKPSRTIFYTHNNSLYNETYPQKSSQPFSFSQSEDWGKGKGKFVFSLKTDTIGLPDRPYIYLFEYSCGITPNNFKPVFRDSRALTLTYETNNMNGQVIECDFSRVKPNTTYTVTGNIYILEKTPTTNFKFTNPSNVDDLKNIEPYTIQVKVKVNEFGAYSKSQ